MLWGIANFDLNIHFKFALKQLKIAQDDLAPIGRHRS
jgi:hypothetical protein